MTDEEMDRVKEIRPRVDTIIEPGAINFITGKRPLSEFNAFVEELRRAGAEELEQIYNGAMDRL